jgi:hypothetical protein
MEHGWSRDELISRYEYGVWFFVIAAGVGTLAVILFLLFEIF